MHRIEDYALIGDCRTAALVSNEGCIDWLCLPYFDSAACFAALVGTKDNGFWSIRPDEEIKAKSRSYQANTIILDTIFETENGKVKLTDFMTITGVNIDIVRMVRGLEGEVSMEMEVAPRFEYGALIPLFIQENEGEVCIIRGPDQLTFRSDTSLKISQQKLLSTFKVSQGEEVFFHMSWSSSHGERGQPVDCHQALKETREYWEKWLQSCHLDDESDHPEIIKRSILTLKAMTFNPAGSIVASITTSLPEAIGAERNWDYRYCWPRDAALAMRAVLNSTGQRGEVNAWRHWLIRATAGLPSQMEVLYKLDGTRPFFEFNIPWLKGYEGSTPVRIGNLAHSQVQLDIYGSVIEVFYMAQEMGLPEVPESWNLVRAMLDHLEKIWQEPDEGIWEVRGPKRHFVHSKVMVWAAFNWCIQASEKFGIEGNVNHWRKIRAEIHDDICNNGFNKKLNSFTMYYESEEVDANLLRMPILGFLPANDPRIEGTVKKIEEDLLIEEGLLARYNPNPEVEGLPDHGRKAFLLCSGWLGEVYALQGREEEAKKVHQKLMSLVNDVGLLSEQYDPETKRQMGNFPQAFSHIALVRLELAIKHKVNPIEK